MFWLCGFVNDMFVARVTTVVAIALWAYVVVHMSMIANV